LLLLPFLCKFRLQERKAVRYVKSSNQTPNLSKSKQPNCDS
jgi:hypothetical protein